MVSVHILAAMRAHADSSHLCRYQPRSIERNAQPPDSHTVPTAHSHSTSSLTHLGCAGGPPTRRWGDQRERVLQGVLFRPARQSCENRAFCPKPVRPCGVEGRPQNRRGHEVGSDSVVRHTEIDLDISASPRTRIRYTAVRGPHTSVAWLMPLPLSSATGLRSLLWLPCCWQCKIDTKHSAQGSSTHKRMRTAGVSLQARALRSLQGCACCGHGRHSRRREECSSAQVQCIQCIQGESAPQTRSCRGPETEEHRKAREPRPTTWPTNQAQSNKCHQSATRQGCASAGAVHGYTTSAATADPSECHNDSSKHTEQVAACASCTCGRQAYQVNRRSASSSHVDEEPRRRPRQ